MHYYVLAFPAWVALLSGADTRTGPARLRPAVTPPSAAVAGLGPVRRYVVWLAAIATSGWLTVGQGPLRRAVHDANLYAWGGLLLLLLLATQLRDRPPETG